MQAAWSKQRHQQPGDLMDEVLLREAGVTCMGSQRDDMICREVSTLLVKLGKTPLIRDRRYQQKQTHQGVLKSYTMTNLRNDNAAYLRASGRWRGESSDSSGSGREFGLHRWPEEWTDLHRSRELPQSRAARTALFAPSMALSSGVRAELESVTPNGTVSALPLHREDPRTTAQPRADSTWRESISKWIHSEEGRQWAKVRALRYEGAADGLEPV